MLALLRTLADARDTLAFGAFMRGPMVGLTDEELLDIAEQVRAAGRRQKACDLQCQNSSWNRFPTRSAKAVLAVLQDLRRRAARTTPRILLSEAIERLQFASFSLPGMEPQRAGARKPRCPDRDGATLQRV